MIVAVDNQIGHNMLFLEGAAVHDRSVRSHRRRQSFNRRVAEFFEADGCRVICKWWLPVNFSRIVERYRRQFDELGGRSVPQVKSNRDHCLDSAHRGLCDDHQAGGTQSSRLSPACLKWVDKVVVIDAESGD